MERSSSRYLLMYPGAICRLLIGALFLVGLSPVAFSQTTSGLTGTIT
jgi:hypothetical protein